MYINIWPSFMMVEKHAVSYKAPVFFYHVLITKLANHVLILTHQPLVFIQLINAEGLNCKWRKKNPFLASSCIKEWLEILHSSLRFSILQLKSEQNRWFLPSRNQPTCTWKLWYSVTEARFHTWTSTYLSWKKWSIRATVIDLICFFLCFSPGDPLLFITDNYSVLISF